MHPQKMPPKAKEILHEAVSDKKGSPLLNRLESAHRSCLLSSQRVQDPRPVVCVIIGKADDAGYDLTDVRPNSYSAYRCPNGGH